MWGGRFAAGPAEIMEEINASIDFDRKLAAQDIAGSEAHIAMLARRGALRVAPGALLLPSPALRAMAFGVAGRDGKAGSPIEQESRFGSCREGGRTREID